MTGRTDVATGGDALLAIIRGEIAHRGPMSFARFMDLALYHPDHGYYRAGACRLGPRGDFVTASDSGRAFGRCLARQLREIDRRVGPFDPFDVVEHGAGRGLLARDILDGLTALDPDLAARLRYTIVESSPAMREASAANAPEAEIVESSPLGRALRGCVLAIELFDALPVHRVRRRAGRLVEVGVDLDPHGTLRECEIEASAEVRRLAQTYGAAAGEQHEAEIATGAAEQLARLTRELECGVCLVLDYGDRADRLYGPTRPRGTLLAYREHQAHERYLEHVGQQDLTAHVNFSQLEESARELGLTTLAFTTQDRFLVANGIVEQFEQTGPAAIHDPRRVKQRLQAMQLIHPLGPGRRFKLLALGRGSAAGQRFDGFDDPFARDLRPLALPGRSRGGQS